jgi:hypothetical protein
MYFERWNTSDGVWCRCSDIPQVGIAPLLCHGDDSALLQILGSLLYVVMREKRLASFAFWGGFDGGLCRPRSLGGRQGICQLERVEGSKEPETTGTSPEKS